MRCGCREIAVEHPVADLVRELKAQDEDVTNLRVAHVAHVALVALEPLTQTIYGILERNGRIRWFVV